MICSITYISNFTYSRYKPIGMICQSTYHRVSHVKGGPEARGHVSSTNLDWQLSFPLWKAPSICSPESEPKRRIPERNPKSKAHQRRAGHLSFWSPMWPYRSVGPTSLITTKRHPHRYILNLDSILSIITVMPLTFITRASPHVNLSAFAGPTPLAVTADNTAIRDCFAV